MCPARATGRAMTACSIRSASRCASASRDSGRISAELVSADAARNVRLAHRLAHALGDLGERGVAGEMADPVVDSLEVVDVDDHERETARVAVRARDLSRERLVEVAAVVEPGQRVEVGELARLLEAPRVLERRRDALRELLGAAEVVVAEPRLRVAGEDAEPADSAGAVDERDAERGPDRSLGRLRHSGTRARPPARPSCAGCPKNDVASGCSSPKPREPAIGFGVRLAVRRAGRGRRRRAAAPTPRRASSRGRGRGRPSSRSG